MDWGPYQSQIDCRHHVGAFADAIFERRVGLIWSAGDDAIWLRPPLFDGQGYGLTLLARYDGGRRAPTPSPSFVDRLDRFLGGYLTRTGQQEIARGQQQLAIARAEGRFISENIIQPVNAFIGRYEYVKDGVAVVFDLAAVIAGGAAAVTLFTVGGTLAVTIGLGAGILGAVGGLALLVEDSRHLWFTVRGDEAGKAALEGTADYQWIEAVGPLLAIPDLALSGRAALREMTTLTRESRTAAQGAAGASRSLQGAQRELREIVADGDQSAGNVARAGNQVAERAADYRRMQAEAQRANRKLLLAREAVFSYGGTVEGMGMYALQPPELAQQLFSPRPSILPTPTPAEAADSRLPAQPFERSDNPFRLLAPDTDRCTAIPTSGLQLTMLVASRPQLRPRR